MNANEIESIRAARTKLQADIDSGKVKPNLMYDMRGLRYYLEEMAPRYVEDLLPFCKSPDSLEDLRNAVAALIDQKGFEHSPELELTKEQVAHEFWRVRQNGWFYDPASAKVLRLDKWHVQSGDTGVTYEQDFDTAEAAMAAAQKLAADWHGLLSSESAHAPTDAPTLAGDCEIAKFAENGNLTGYGDVLYVVVYGEDLVKWHESLKPEEHDSFATQFARCQIDPTQYDDGSC